MFFRVITERPPVQPETLFTIADVPITNAMLTAVFVMLLFLCVSFFWIRKPRLIAGKLQSFMEVLVEGFVGLLHSITGTRQSAEKLLPLIGTLFLFFGISNLITLLPGIGAFTYENTALLRTPTNDFNLTFSVALAMVTLTQIGSVKEFGLLGHIGKYIKVKDVVKGFRQSIGAGVMAIVDFLIGLLDIISEIAKVISLSLRLFGNMYAGEVLAGILLGAFSLLVPAPWLAMNLLVAILQALVFGALTAAYYTLAVQKAETEPAS